VAIAEPLQLNGAQATSARVSDNLNSFVIRSPLWIVLIDRVVGVDDTRGKRIRRHTKREPWGAQGHGPGDQRGDREEDGAGA
jgi:hypothetical protein